GMNIDYFNDEVRVVRRSTEGLWTKETVDITRFSHGYTSLLTDSSGKLHFVYLSSESQVKMLKRAIFDSDHWNTDIITYCKTIDRTLTLRVDSQDYAHIGYVDGRNDLQRYATQSSGDWLDSLVDDELYSGRSHAMVLDESQRPHVCYSGYNSQIKYAVYDNDVWESEILRDYDVCRTEGHNIDLDSAGNPHIGAVHFEFNGYGTGDYYIFHIYKTDSGWVTDLVDTFFADVAESLPVSIILADGDIPFIIYVHPDGLRCACKPDGDWLYEIVDTVGSDHQPAITPDGNLCLVYTNYYYVKYAERTAPDQWQITVLEEQVNSLYPSLAIDLNGRPHITYYSVKLSDAYMFYWYLTDDGWNREEFYIDTEKAYINSPLAVDSQNRLHAVFCNTDTGVLQHAVRNLDPDPTATVTMTPFETYTPTPTSTPTPTEPPCSPTPPAGTATPFPSGFMYDLVISDTMFNAGDNFYLARYCANYRDETVLVDEYIILDVFNNYWFWPSWMDTPDFYTWGMYPDQVIMAVILDFPWPSGTGACNHLFIWGGIVASGTTDLLAYDWVEFGYD
ncbi:hypothetical protein JW979_08740, partial [bacterium]|nr:hypothetical protein [candidate division CSSED10-310 bacterium]